jgi:hypothetical protein
MTAKLKINGIYDLRTLKQLKGTYQHFGFDFDPLSLNYIQGHIFKDLLIHSYSTDDFYYLKMKNVPDFIALSTLNEASLGAKRKVDEIHNMVIEVAPKDFKLLEKIDFPFWLNLSHDLDLSLLSHPRIKGLTISNQHTTNSFERERFYRQLNELFDLKIKNNFKIELTLNWNEPIEQSLVDFFEFDLISLPINSLVEVCYRNVNLNKLQGELALIEKNFSEI